MDMCSRKIDLLSLKASTSLRDPGTLLVATHTASQQTSCTCAYMFYHTPALAIYVATHWLCFGSGDSLISPAACPPPFSVRKVVGYDLSAIEQLHSVTAN